jgi:hypothetical protein
LEPNLTSVTHDYLGESITSLTPINKSPDKISDATIPENILTKGFWTKEQTKLAFNLYCQIPYGRIHGRNPEIVTLSKIIGRTPDAVAMKMLNIASLDPIIIKSGRTGLGNASNLDRAVWEEFNSNWEAAATECTLIFQQLSESKISDPTIDEISAFSMQDFTGETRQVLTHQRIKQNFFRRSVLSSYRGRCCMSGLSDSRLLVASHIIPWSVDKANRLNPSNGLCLSAIHDKAFDNGLLSLSDSGEILISDELRRVDDNFMKNIFLSLENKVIEMPEKFAPNITFLKHRNKNTQKYNSFPFSCKYIAL